jgi:AcrR family transcriptional regulator
MNLKSSSEAGGPTQDETRQQLLEAAGGVFAEVGFRNATIRDICRRAGANVAAVNYHFGDKETLYTEVLRHSQQKAFEKYPPLMGAGADAPPEQKLRAFIQSFLLRIFDDSSTAWFGKMMSREMVEPTAALDLLVAERMQPMADLLRGIVAEILDCPAQAENVRLCCFSVVSQCVFYHHCRTMIFRLFPEQRLDASAVEQLAGHIARFSLAAMKHLPDAKSAKPGSKLPGRGRR